MEVTEHVRPHLLPEIAFCREKTRLQSEYLEAIRELMSLHSEQTSAVIEGDPDFARFDVLIHVANQWKDARKYELVAHIDTHHCC
jgi:hypothetical protein